MEHYRSCTITNKGGIIPVHIYLKNKKHSSALFRAEELRIYLAKTLSTHKREATITRFLSWAMTQNPAAKTPLHHFLHQPIITLWNKEYYTLQWKWTTDSTPSCTLHKKECTIAVPFAPRLVDPQQPEYPTISKLPTTTQVLLLKTLTAALAQKYHTTLYRELCHLHRLHFPKEHLETLVMEHTKSRWGSCSQEGIITLHSGLLLLPYSYMEYIMVHELTHLRYKHHRKSFWDTVGSIIPQYSSIRQSLNRYQ